MEQVTSEHAVSFGHWGPPNTVLTLARRHRVKCGLDVYPGEVPGHLKVVENDPLAYNELLRCTTPMMERAVSSKPHTLYAHSCIDPPTAPTPSFTMCHA